MSNALKDRQIDGIVAQIDPRRPLPGLVSLTAAS
jgi:hypothetical protein